MASFILRILSFSSSSSHTSQNSSPTSPSSPRWSKRRRRSSGFEEEYQAQKFSGSWIDGQRLVEYLNYKFGRHYKLQVCIASSCCPTTCIAAIDPSTTTTSTDTFPGLAEVKRVHVVCRGTIDGRRDYEVLWIMTNFERTCWVNVRYLIKIMISVNRRGLKMRRHQASWIEEYIS